MAKAQEVISLFMSEKKENTSNSGFGWRRIAVLGNAPVGGGKIIETFFQSQDKTRSDKYTIKPKNIGETLIARETGTVVGGDIELERRESPTLYEVVTLREFENLSLWDDDDRERVRNTINNTGFTIFKLISRNVEQGNAKLILRFPKQESQYENRIYGLLFDDSTKLSFIDDKSNSDLFRLAKLSDTDIANPTKFTPSLPVVDLTDSTFIKYSAPFSNSGNSRMFLASEPVIIDDFLIHSPKEFAPIFLQRALDDMKSNIIMSNGKPLPSKDISTICDALIRAAGNENGNLGQLTRIKSGRIVAELSIGLRESMEDIKKKIDSDPAYLNNIRNLLWRDQKIREESIKGGKELWLEEADAERKELEAKIENLHKEKLKLASVDTQLTQKKRELEALEADKEIKQKAINSIDDKLSGIAEGYREKVEDLILAAGVGHQESILLRGEPVPTAEATGELPALYKNLQLMTGGKTAIATNIADAVLTVIDKGAHICVRGNYAASVADALSISRDGTTASVVAAGGTTCALPELLQKIRTCETSVVLVEGVYGILPVNIVLALARHTTDKLLVFSDDVPNLSQKMPFVVSCHIAKLDILAMFGQEMLSSNETMLSYAAVAASADSEDAVFEKDMMTLPFTHIPSPSGYTTKPIQQEDSDESEGTPDQPQQQTKKEEHKHKK